MTTKTTIPAPLVSMATTAKKAHIIKNSYKNFVVVKGSGSDKRIDMLSTNVR